MYSPCERTHSQSSLSPPCCRYDDRGFVVILSQRVDEVAEVERGQVRRPTRCTFSFKNALRQHSHSTTRTASCGQRYHMSSIPFTSTAVQTVAVLRFPVASACRTAFGDLPVAAAELFPYATIRPTLAALHAITGNYAITSRSARSPGHSCHHTRGLLHSSELQCPEQRPCGLHDDLWRPRRLLQRRSGVRGQHAQLSAAAAPWASSSSCASLATFSLSCMQRVTPPALCRRQLDTTALAQAAAWGVC